MGKALTTMRRVLRLLEKHYGRPKPPAVTGPLEMILFENVGYLADDEQRAAAYAALKKQIGAQPEKILAASDAALVEIARLGGIMPELRAGKLRQIAELAHWIFKDDLRAILKKPLAEAKKDLKGFPSIGEPGAEKILLFAGSHPILALDSNGLRVLLRLGFGKEDKNYTRSYRSAQEAAAPGLPLDTAWLTEAHQLLRRHGQELCKTNHPRCEACP